MSPVSVRLQVSGPKERAAGEAKRPTEQEMPEKPGQGFSSPQAPEDTRVSDCNACKGNLLLDMKSSFHGLLGRIYVLSLKKDSGGTESTCPPGSVLSVTAW